MVLWRFSIEKHPWNPRTRLYVCFWPMVDLRLGFWLISGLMGCFFGDRELTKRSLSGMNMTIEKHLFPIVDIC